MFQVHNREHGRELTRIAMREAGVHPAVLHAVDVFDLLVVEADQYALDGKFREDWQETIRDYCRRASLGLPQSFYLTKRQYEQVRSWSPA